MPETNNIIKFKDAVQLVYDLLRLPECTSLRTVAYATALGGTISVDGFLGITKLLNFYKGILGWVCWNRTTNTFPGFFISFEHREDFNPDDLPQSPLKPMLTTTKSFFTFSGGVSYDIVWNYLRNHTIELSFIDKQIDSDTVSDFAADFIKYFPKDSASRKYNHYPIAFFEDGDNDVRKFIFEQKKGEPDYVKYVRYYFGYSAHDEPNRLRIILIAVDAEGKNITLNPDDQSKDAIILQKSWPPGGF